MLTLGHLQAVSGLLDRLAGIDLQAQALVFVHTAEAGGRPLAMASLAAYLKLPRANVQRLVTRLIRLGLATAAPAAADRRRIEIRPTAAGVSCAEAALQSVMQALLAYRQDAAKAQAARIALRKICDLDPATASPKIRAIYDWAKRGTGDLPVNLLSSLYVVRPDFDNISKSEVVHWGSGVVHGNDHSAILITKFQDSVSTESLDYNRSAAQHYRAATQRIVAHRIEVDWNRPLKHYERILVPHAQLGVIGCTQWY